MGVIVVPSFIGVSLEVTGVGGGIFTIGDFWRAAVSSVWNPEVNAGSGPS